MIASYAVSSLHAGRREQAPGHHGAGVPQWSDAGAAAVRVVVPHARCCSVGAGMCRANRAM
jgi:hypothetical protein